MKIATREKARRALPDRLKNVAIVGVVALGVALLALRYRLADVAPALVPADLGGQIALARYLVGDHGGAAVAWRKRLDFWPSQEARNQFTGIAPLLKQDYPGAEREAAAALARNPNDIQATVTLAQAALEQGRFADAARHADGNIRLGVFQPFNARLIAGLAAVRQGDRDAAIRHLLIAARLGGPGSRDSMAFALLSTIAAQERGGGADRDPALMAVLWRVMALWDPPVQHLANRYARRTIAAGRNVAQAWAIIGAGYLASGHIDESLDAAALALHADPGEVEGYWLQANVHATRANIAGEIEAVTAAFALDADESFLIERTLSVLAEKAGDHPRVLQLGEILADNGTARTHSWLGYSATYLGRHAEALQHYTRAFAIDPIDAEISMRLARAFRENGDQANAIRQAEITARLNSQWNAPLVLIADLHVKHGRFAEAIEAYQRGFRMQAPNAGQLANFCVALLHGQRYEESAACIDQVLKREPGNALANRLRHEVMLNRDLARAKAKGGT